MFRLKKTAAIMLASLSLLGATGCYGTNKTIIMASDVGYAPYEYLNSENKLVGIDVEIGNTVAKSVDASLKVVDTDRGDIFAALENEECDIAISAISSETEIPEGIYISKVYSSTTQVILVRNNSKIDSAFDLAGKNVGFVSKLAGPYCVEMLESATPMYYEKGSEAVRALILKKIDAVIIDKELAEIYVSENSEITELSSVYFSDEFVIATRADDTEIIEAVDNLLTSEEESNIIKKIQNKYIVAE